MSSPEMAVVQAYLKELSLSAIAKQLPSTLREAEQGRHDPLEFLRVLLEAELNQRRINKAERCLRQAKFPYHKGLEEFDFTALPSLDKAKVLNLACGKYIKKHQSVILIGNTGTGKTHSSPWLTSVAASLSPPI